MSLALSAACSAGGEDEGALALRPDDSPPGTVNEAPPTGAGGQGPSAGTGNGSFDLGDVGDPVAPMGCQQAERVFAPKIPAVFLLVDRSGSMFTAIPPTNVTPWGALRSGVLEVMSELQDSVHFGFGAFSGKALGPLMCDFDAPAVPPALNNYGAIATVYEPLDRPLDSKETPTVLGLAAAAEQLRNTPSEGDRYILFVTDGEPDYCDDGNNLCPPDSVVGLLQDLAAGVDRQGATFPPIQTLVFGITAPSTSIQPTVLQSFANAGAGLPVAPFGKTPAQALDPNYVDPTFDQCQQVAGWAADLASTQKLAARGATIGTYATDPALAGSAPVFRPDPSDQAALTEQIRTALAGVKSCTFDLGDDGVQVDIKRQDLGEKARVVVNGTPVPFDPVNGWSMLSETTVALEGQACSAWRNPTIETSINFDFPCDIFVPR